MSYEDQSCLRSCLPEPKRQEVRFICSFMKRENAILFLRMKPIVSHPDARRRRVCLALYTELKHTGAG